MPYIENTTEYKMIFPMLHYSIIVMEMEVDFVRLMPGKTIWLGISQFTVEWNYAIVRYLSRLNDELLKIV